MGLGVESSGGCCPSLGELFAPIVYWGRRRWLGIFPHSSERRALNQFGVILPISLRAMAVSLSIKDRPSSVAKELM